MRTEEEIKKELEYFKNQYVLSMNNGSMTATLKTKLRSKLDILYWVLKEGAK